MTMQQVDSVFCSTFKRGCANITTWGRLGLGGKWAGRAISINGRNSASGAYGFFKEAALKRGDFKPNVKEQPGSSAVVQAISAGQAGIGCPRISYKSAGMRAVPPAGKAGKTFDATCENRVSGDFPLARFPCVCINNDDKMPKPGEPVNLPACEFLRFVVSKEGREVAVKDICFAIPKALIDEIHATLE